MFHPRTDQLERQGLSWIHNIGGEVDLSPEALAKKYLNDSKESVEDFYFVDKLIKLRCKRANISFWSANQKFRYCREDFLKGTESTLDLKICISDLVKFYAHLTSSYVDMELSLSFEEKAYYVERGLLTLEGKTTSRFCSQWPFLVAQEAQKRLEGMRPSVSLKLFNCVLKEISKKNDHRSRLTVIPLLKILNKTIYLHEMGQKSLGKVIYSEDHKKLSETLLNKTLNSSQKLLIRSGHHRHTFYVGVIQETTQQDIIVRFSLGNFNRTAESKNIRNTEYGEKENDFYPYVIALKIPRCEKPGHKQKVRKKLSDEEISECAFYITFLQRSSSEGNIFARKASKKLTGIQAIGISRFKKALYARREELFSHIKSQDLTQDGFFSLERFQKYLENKNLNDFLGSILPDDFVDKSVDHDMYWHELQFVQTLICLDVIYSPWEYGAKLLARDYNFERTQPSFPIQRIGNCTIYSLKMALYPLAGLDYRDSKQIESIKHLNIDIALKVVDLIKELLPKNFKLSDVDSVPFPVPPGCAIKEITEARKLRSEGKLDGAKQVMLQACQTYEADPYAWAELGIVFDELKDNKQAIEQYKKSLMILDDPDVHTNLAICYATDNRLQKAKEHLDLAVDLNPYSCQTYYNRMQLFYQQRLFDCALKDVDKLLQLDPNNPEYFLLKGRLLCHMKRDSEGLNHIVLAYDKGLKTNDLFYLIFQLQKGSFIHFMKLYHETPSRLFIHRVQKNLSQIKTNYKAMIKADPQHENNAKALAALKESQKNLEDLSLLIGLLPKFITRQLND